MTVIIEYVILDNMTFNYLIFYLAARTVKRKVKHLRLLSAAFVGTLCAIGLALAPLGSPAALAVKLALAPLLCLAAFGFTSLKAFIRYNILFLAYTFVLGGVIIATFYLDGTTVTALTAINYSAEIPVGTYVAGVIATLLGGEYCANYIKRKKQASVNLFDAVISADKKYDVCAIIDSGNSLERDGVPTCFAVSGDFKKRIAPYLAECLMNGTLVQIDFDTVGGSGRTNAAPINVTIGNKTRPALLAVAEADVDGYEIILHKSFLDDGT